MERVFLKRTSEVRKEMEKLEKALDVDISIEGKRVSVSGDSLNEYEAVLVLGAIDFGYSVKNALTLKNEEIVFRKIPIKNFTKRKKLWDVKARIVGKEGKTKRTMEDISGCAIILSDNTVGILGPAESIEEATTAVANLIRGSKQANVYRYLERMNTYRKIIKNDRKERIK